MRHRKKVKKLGRTASHRKSLLQNIAASLIEHHQIRTTLAKAKAAQSHIEKLITYAKEDTVHSRRLAFKFLQNRTLVKKLFDEIATTYDDRKGGYTRVVKLGRRRGDGAELAILQLVGFEQFLVEESPKKKKRKKAAPPKAAAKSRAKKEAAEEPVEETPAEEGKPKTKKEAKKAKAEEKAEPEAVEEEKAEKPETKAEEAKKEKAEKPKKEAEEAKEEKTEKKAKTKKAKKEDKEDSQEESKKS